jgi:hypothetical protein
LSGSIGVMWCEAYVSGGWGSSCFLVVCLSIRVPVLSSSVSLPEENVWVEVAPLRQA